MIEKNELPILEYDPVSQEVLKPGHDNEGVRLPEKCLFAFSLCLLRGRSR